MAHRLSTVRNADKIFVFAQGRVVEVGSHDELLAMRNVYYNLVNAQVTANDLEDTQSGEKFNCL